jgi:hypothetical protein
MNSRNLPIMKMKRSAEKRSVFVVAIRPALLENARMTAPREISRHP